jgi:hypothetical protein
MATMIDRLRTAAKVAPAVRKGRERRIAIVDAKGRVIGYRSLADVTKQVLERAKIELDVEDPFKRPRAVCKACGRMFDVRAKNTAAKYCPNGCETQCAECVKPMRVAGWRMIAGPCRCKSCAVAITSRNRTAETHQKIRVALRKRLDSMTSEQIAHMTRGIRKPKKIHRCSICGKQLASNTMAPSIVAKRNGKPPRCKQCRYPGGTP